MYVDDNPTAVFIKLSDHEIELLTEKASNSGDTLDKFIEKILSSYMKE